MTDCDLPAAVQQLVEASLGLAAETPPDLRRAVRDRAAALSGADRPAADVPEDLRAFVDKVARHAHRVTDEDFAALAAAGYREDELFELTICAALGASVARFERGLVALGEASR